MNTNPLRLTEQEIALLADDSPSTIRFVHEVEHAVLRKVADYIEDADPVGALRWLDEKIRAAASEEP